jgi:peptidoglycan/xylan/chitin deacetylase (PgdA/CDA1 family)
MVFRTPLVLQWLSPSLIWSGDPDKIYLTFDDGPIPEITEFVLDQLNQFKVKATFFCIGDNIRKHPEIFKRLISEGHQAGNHTMNHLNGWRTENRKYSDNIRGCAEEMDKVIPGFTTDLFRPPYGRIKSSQIKGLPAGTKTVMWTTLTHDYRSDLTPEKCLNRTLGALRPGSVVVFHDSLKARKNMEYTLPRFLEHTLSKGYRFGLI